MIPEYAYDIECLRNLFTLTFVNVDDKKDVKVFWYGFGKENRKELIDFLNQEMFLVGYNNHSFDDPVLRYALHYRGSELVSNIYRLSQLLIHDKNYNNDLIRELKYPTKHRYLWHSVDLMRIMAFDKLGISLKQVAINLKWPKIQDMPLDHDVEVTEDQVGMILDYNLNDVLITEKLSEEIKPLRELRRELSKLYHVDLTSASDSRMANLILEEIYSKKLGVNLNSIRKMRTERPRVLLRDCIANFVSFETPILKELLKRISSTYVFKENDYKYSEELFFAGIKIVLGVGGLHSVDTAGKFESDDKYLIQDMDVASYYPNLIINNKFYPQHLGEDFITVLKGITEERLHAKKQGDKVKADGLKITINSIFGKLGSEFFWLHDPKQFLSTTISGQMGLLMLIESLNAKGIEVISCNTDGVICKIDRNLLDDYYKVAREWEEKTGLQLEYTPYKKYIRRDVNSYITEKPDGGTKEKGAFVKGIDLKKSYRMPIVPTALYNYFIKGTPVRETLEKCDDIMDFCISQKTGGTFVLELHTMSGVEKLQKTNRFYVSKKGGSLIKNEYSSGRKIGLYVGNSVRVLNDYDPATPFEEYGVDLNFYEKEVMKIVDEIEPKQMSIFSLL